MYVCMHLLFMYALVYVRTYVCMCVGMHVITYVYIFLCTYVCMFVEGQNGEVVAKYGLGVRYNRTKSPETQAMERLACNNSRWKAANQSKD